MRGDPDVAATCGVPGTCVVGEAERPRKSNGLKRWMAKTRKRLTMAPAARSTTRRVTRSSAASALAKKKGGTEGAAVAKMPPKKRRKKPVEGATKRKIPKGKRSGSVDEGGENRREGRCPDCGEFGWYGEECDGCDNVCGSYYSPYPSECDSSN
jgi:hypothetical protein